MVVILFGIPRIIFGIIFVALGILRLYNHGSNKVDKAEKYFTLVSVKEKILTSIGGTGGGLTDIKFATRWSITWPPNS